MENEVKLVICLTVYDLEAKNIEFAYGKMDINNMDAFTFPFQNEEEFFAANKGLIFSQLLKFRKSYDIGNSPSDIYLNTEEKNPIYLLKKGKKIKALFQNIEINKEMVFIADLAKNRLKMGMLKYLYLFDIQGLKDPNYESIFKNCDVKVYERIKNDLIQEENIEYIWNFLQTKKRFYPILRFIFTYGTNEVLWNTFSSTIPLGEEMEEKGLAPRKSKKYW